MGRYRRVDKNSPLRKDSNYYFILPYAKNLKTFFASDIHQALKKNGFEFTVGAIVSAIEYWISREVIKTLPQIYHSRFFSGTIIKKYIYIKNPE